MPKQDAAAILGEILSEADALIRLRLKQGLELPHVSVDEPPREALLEARGELVIDLDGDAPIQADRVANRRHEGAHAGAWLEDPVRALELGQRDHALGKLR